MRILHVLNDVTDQGNGIVHAAIDLSAGQVKIGHTVAIASGGGGHEALLRRANITHLHLDQRRAALTLLRSLFALRRHIRDFAPDIVHTHVRTGLLMAWLWSKFMGYPLVAHLHNVHENESVIMKLADRVIVVSSSVGKTMAKRGIPEKKIRVVLNGPLDSPRMLNLAEVRAVQLHQPAIVTVCGMNHRKGIAELLEAFNSVAPHNQDAHLYLVGNGPDLETFRNQASESPHTDRIHFEGFQSLPQAYMKSAEVFVLASRRDSFPLVLLEARQVGCAIVASDVDGMPEALDHGEAGILFPPQDVPRLAEAILTLIQDPEACRSWQARSLKGIERFRYTYMARNMDQVYIELTDKPHSHIAQQAPLAG